MKLPDWYVDGSKSAEANSLADEAKYERSPISSKIIVAELEGDQEISEFKQMIKMAGLVLTENSLG